MSVVYHRMSRRRRSELSENPEAVLHGAIGTDYRHAFVREAGDREFRATMTESVLTRPTASSQDPASMYLFATFWMKQPDYLLVRTGDMEKHFETTAPYQHYWWTAKTLGDCQTILVNSADRHFPAEDSSPLVVGRDQHSHWTYIKWNRAAEEWLDTFAAAAHVLARIRIERQRRHERWGALLPSGIAPIIETLIDGRLNQHGYDMAAEAPKWLHLPSGHHRGDPATRDHDLQLEAAAREWRRAASN